MGIILNNHQNTPLKVRAMGRVWGYYENPLVREEEENQNNLIDCMSIKCISSKSFHLVTNVDIDVCFV